MMTTIEGVGPQLQRASEGTDPRGWLVFHWLTSDLQAAEDATAYADKERSNFRARGFERPATDAERALLEHLGHQLPDNLVTFVRHRTRGVRERRVPQLETQEVTTP
jgi:hypothetical protein